MDFRKHPYRHEDALQQAEQREHGHVGCGGGGDAEHAHARQTGQQNRSTTSSEHGSLIFRPPSGKHSHVGEAGQERGADHVAHHEQHGGVVGDVGAAAGQVELKGASQAQEHKIEIAF